MPDLVVALKNLIESDEFCNRHKKRPEDFTRVRALPFQNLIYYMINLPVAAYETELCNLNKNINGLHIAESLATKGALTKAREKLKHMAFIELNDHFVYLVQMRFAPNRRHGHFLLATDGTLCAYQRPNRLPSTLVNGTDGRVIRARKPAFRNCMTC